MIKLVIKSEFYEEESMFCNYKNDNVLIEKGISNNNVENCIVRKNSKILVKVIKP